VSNVIQNREFKRIHEKGGGEVTDISFEHCTFNNCAIGMTTDLTRRKVIKNVILLDCLASNCSVGPIICDNVVIESLRTNNEPLFVRGAVFRHVSLRGDFDRLILTWEIFPGLAATLEEERCLQEANRLFYGKVDWALDIHEARFMGLSIRSLPGHLVRRDSASQIYIRRENLLDDRWRNLDYGKTSYDTAIEMFLRRGDEDLILTLNSRGAKRSAASRVLNALREHGIAEPN
jgi:hypothetical protein